LNETSACDLPMMSHFIFISNLIFFEWNKCLCGKCIK
jgi:hypothetical protein